MAQPTDIVQASPKGVSQIVTPPAKPIPSMYIDEDIRGKIFFIRGVQVMLDCDLAAIYGYSTKAFNQQVKNNIEKFCEEDFMFQLTTDEVSFILSGNGTLQQIPSRSKFLTMNNGGRGHNIKYAPFAFTESGIYMLMTVLKGELATQQSKTLIRTFRSMKQFIVDNQSLLGQREYLQLSLQTTTNTQQLLEFRDSLAKIDDKVAGIVNSLGEMVTQSQLAEVMLDFGNPIVRRGWLILNGQPVESDLAYQQIYAEAQNEIIIIDDYINLKTLSLTASAPASIKIRVVSDNVYHYLHQFEVDDYRAQYPKRDITFVQSMGMFHDRYIVLDFQSPSEKVYHCGASSKDGGNKVTTISPITEVSLYRAIINKVLNNEQLIL